MTHIRILSQNICLLLIGLVPAAWADTASYTTAGTYTWTCPAGVTLVQVECWGGGGAGGGAHRNTSNAYGSGGGGGAYAKSTIAVVPGNGYTVIVGGGGQHTTATISANAQAASGGNSSFGSGSTVMAVGGGGGYDAYNGAEGTAGSGGASGSSTGTTTYSGGNGYKGSSPYGGGGGSSAGSSGNGNNAASGGNGATAPTGGGAGGNGGNSSAKGGSNGGAPGGGGGGAYSSGAQQSGGNGADGQVILTYTVYTGVIGTWNVDADGNWSSAGNWNGGVPTAAGDVATFGVGSSLRTVTLDASESVGAIFFTNANSFTIADGGLGNTLTLDNNGAGVAISVTAGTANSIGTQVSLNDNATLTVSAGGSLNVSGVVSSTGAETLTVNGAGTVILGGANTYTGGTSINGGILNAGVAQNSTVSGPLGASGTISFGGGTLQFSAASSAWDPSARFNTAASQAYSIDTANQSVTFATALTSSGGTLTMLGAGTLTLDGVNTYSGSTTVSAGTLTIGGAGQLGGGSYTGTLSIGASGTFSYNSTASQTLWSVTGAGGLALTGSGTLFLTNAPSYTGPTVVSGGTLVLQGPNAASSGLYNSTSITINNGGTIQVNADNSFQGNNSANTHTVTINTGGTLTVLASADSGTGPSSHITGPLNLNGGTLAAPATGFYGYGNWSLRNGVVVAGGVNPSTISANSVALAQTGGTTFNVANGGTSSGIDLLVSGAFQHTSDPDTGLIKTGNGTMALSSAQNNYTSSTTINGGTLEIIGSGSLGGGSYAGLITNNASFVYNSSAAQTLSGVISGTGTLTQAGGGILTLGGLNTYGGNTTISAGTLELAQSSATLATNSTVTIASGAQLQLDVATVTNQVANLVTNGVAAGNGLYSSANSAGFITGSGYLQVGAVAVGPSGPAQLTYSYSAGVLSLSWPAGQSWRLQMQTNSLATGLGTNWIYVTDGSVSSTNITVDPAIPTAFYRLTFP